MTAEINKPIAIGAKMPTPEEHRARIAERTRYNKAEADKLAAEQPELDVKNVAADILAEDPSMGAEAAEKEARMLLSRKAKTVRAERS